MNETNGTTAPPGGAHRTAGPAGTGRVLVRCFSVIAAVEAFTWAGLLAGMYFKYIAGTTELGVRIFGSLHGAAFIVYLVVTLLVALHLRWPLRWTTLLALAAAVPPFTTVVFEVWARRRGRLTPPGARLPAAAPPYGGPATGP